jgi:hypothetical protein
VAGSFVETNRKKLGGQKMGWRHTSTVIGARLPDGGRAEADARKVGGDRRAWSEKARR